MDKGLADEETQGLEEVHKDMMELMVADSKPHFTNI